MINNKEKIGIIIDSGSSVYGKKPNNFTMVPLVINEIINGETYTYRDQIDLSFEEIYNKVKNDCKLSTSQSIIGDCIDTLEDMLTKYDKVFIFPLSKGLSGTYNTWLQVLKEVDTKNAIVFDHNDVGTGAYLAAKDSLDKYIQGYTFEEIQKYLDQRNKRREAVILINDLDILIRGGRLSSFKGKLAKFLNLKILVSFQGKLDVMDKTNNLELAVSKSLKHINSNIHFIKKGIKNIIIVSNNIEKDNSLLDDYKGFVIKWLDKHKVNIKKEDIKYDILPSVISIHTGINTLTIWIEANE